MANCRRESVISWGVARACLLALCLLEIFLQNARVTANPVMQETEAHDELSSIN